MAKKKNEPEDPKKRKRKPVASAKSKARRDYDDDLDDDDDYEAEPSPKKKLQTYQEKRLAGLKNIFRVNPTPGRPPLLNEEIIEKTAKLLEVCAYIETVLNSLGIGRMAYMDWIKKGRAEQKRIYHGEKPDPTKSLYLRFTETIDKHIAISKINKLATIEAHGTMYWQALAWLLERQFPDEFGNQAHVIKEILQNQKETNRKLQQFEEEQRAQERAKE